MKQKREPKYVSIYKELRTYILYDDAVAEKLPPENQLMERFHVSRTTIRKATQLLKDENLIESRKGRGTEILLGNVIANHGHTQRMTTVTQAYFTFKTKDVESRKHSEMLVDVVPAVTEVADALKLAPGSNVYRIRWLHYVNDVPFLYLVNYVRIDLAPTLPEVVKGKDSLYPVLADEYGLIFEEAVETVDPIISDFITAKLLDVPVGTPLLLVCRTARFNAGPTEYSRQYIRADQRNLTMYLK